MGRKKQRVTIGYRYHLGMHLMLGHSNMDEISKVRVGEKVAWTPSVGHIQIKDTYQTGDDNSAYSSSVRYDAQTFLVDGNGYYTNKIDLKLYRDVGYSSNTTVAIYGLRGDGVPDDSNVLGTSDGTVASAITTNSAGDWVRFTFATPVWLNSNTSYAIVLKPEGSYIYWRYDSNNGYTSGSLYLRNNNVWVISTGNDALFRVYPAEGSAPNNTITIDNYNLFGGDEKEGGVAGDLHLLFGASDQAQNPYLVDKTGDANLPAFRGITSTTGRVYVGTSPYMKPWAFMCRRVLTQVSGDDQWLSAKAIINAGEEDGDDLNPAHIIRECLIDNEWGLGFDVDNDIDSDSFTLAATILYDEDFGLSLLWDQTQPIEEFIGSILNTIDGFLYQDLSTGKWVLSLARNPLSSTIDESTSYTGLSQQSDIPFVTNQRRGQSFTPDYTFSADTVSLKLGTDYTTETIVCEIQDTAAGLPNGNVRATATLLASELPAADAVDWVTFTLDKRVRLIADTQYAIIVYTNAAIPNGIYFTRLLYLATAGPPYGYTGGTEVQSNNAGSSWSLSSRNDLYFRIYDKTPETFDEDSIISVEDFARPAYGEIVNQVVVNWWDKINDKARPATAQDIALIEKQNNNVIETTSNHFGICNATLANTIAERELNLASSMLASMRIIATRKLSHLKPNDTFYLSWDELGISSMLVRVHTVNYGSLLSNAVELQCIEDVFTAASTTYVNPPDTQWTDPIIDALDISEINIQEIPYWIMINELSNITEITALAATSGFVLFAVQPPSNDAFDFEYLSRLSASYDFSSEGLSSWPPTAELVDDIYQESGQITLDLTNTLGLDTVTAGGYALIGNEIVYVVSADDDNSQVVIERGVMDTVPLGHIAGDVIYFIGDGYTDIGTEFADGDQPQLKILPRTATGKLDEDSASIQTATALDSRIIRPYPPGDLQFNSVSFPTFLSTAITGGFDLTWAHRDRTDTDQIESIILHTDATDYGPEVGTTYTVKVYDGDDSLIHTESAIAVTSYSYTEADEISDAGALQSQLRFEVYSVRDGYDSFHLYDVLIKRTPTGTAAVTSTANGSMSRLVTLTGSSTAATTASAELSSVLLTASSSGSSSADGALTIS